MKTTLTPMDERFRVFDAAQDYAVVERRLPHWSQAGTICFITWRTWDSIPAPVLKTWLAARDEWLRRHGIDPASVDWHAALDELAPALLQEYQLLISDRWNDHLDEGHGACVLRRPEFAEEVAASLRHFDGQRYDLADFVVMPNHVHVLAAVPDPKNMLAQCESWKHYTATKINRMLGRKGRFWQQDGFDHLVRSTEQFQYLRNYIVDNPRRAKLRLGEFIRESKQV